MSKHTISYDALEKVSDQLETMETAEAATAASQAFADSQPAVMAYLLSTSEDLESEEDAETLLYIGHVIHLAALETNADLAKVTPEMIEKAESEFLSQMSAVTDLGEDYTKEDFMTIFGEQPDLNSFLLDWVDQLMEEDADSDAVNTIYSVLQVVANAYDLALNAPKAD